MKTCPDCQTILLPKGRTQLSGKMLDKLRKEEFRSVTKFWLCVNCGHLESR